MATSKPRNGEIIVHNGARHVGIPEAAIAQQCGVAAHVRPTCGAFNYSVMKVRGA